MKTYAGEKTLNILNVKLLKILGRFIRESAI